MKRKDSEITFIIADSMFDKPMYSLNLQVFLLENMKCSRAFHNL